MKTIFTLIILAFVTWSVSGQTKEKNELNDKTFDVQLKKTKGKRSGWDWTKDEISFQSGSISSKVMSEKEDFPEAACSVTVDSSSSVKTVSFKAKVKNTGVSTIVWEGTITDKQIEGTATWTNMQGTMVYKFSGTLK